VDVPQISAPALWFFRWIVRGYLRTHFTAVRISHDSNLANLRDKQLIIYGNHASWWDPMICVRAAQVLMPDRKHYAPMDEESLRNHPILSHIGIFGVKKDSRRGAAQFLRIGQSVVEAGDVLWVTPQGRFADARERPLAFKSGLAMLATKIQGGCTVLPLAMEYVFWDERKPEVLMHFGEPVQVSGSDVQGSTQQLEARLLESMEHLKKLAIARNPSAFRVLGELTR
jgi:1-acyl-sn-glycerol-3-phosphate acyltransferase